jgi:hypothetical protein
MRWAGYVARMKMHSFGGEPKRPPARPTRKWEDNIKMDLKRNRMADSGIYSSGLE